MAATEEEEVPEVLLDEEKFMPLASEAARQAVLTYDKTNGYKAWLKQMATDLLAQAQSLVSLNFQCSPILPGVAFEVSPGLAALIDKTETDVASDLCMAIALRINATYQLSVAVTDGNIVLIRWSQWMFSTSNNQQLISDTWKRVREKYLKEHKGAVFYSREDAGNPELAKIVKDPKRLTDLVQRCCLTCVSKLQMFSPRAICDCALAVWVRDCAVNDFKLPDGIENDE